MRGVNETRRAKWKDEEVLEQKQNQIKTQRQHNHREASQVRSEVQRTVENFDFLWNGRSKLRLKMTVPDTILFHHGQPMKWFFTSKKDDVLLKNQSQLTLSKIAEAFGKHYRLARRKNEKLKYMCVTKSVVMGRLRVEFLSAEQFLRMLDSRADMGRLLSLQTFVSGTSKGLSVYHNTFKRNPDGFRTSYSTVKVKNDRKLTGGTSAVDQFAVASVMHLLTKTDRKRAIYISRNEVAVRSTAIQVNQRLDELTLRLVKYIQTTTKRTVSSLQAEYILPTGSKNAVLTHIRGVDFVGPAGEPVAAAVAERGLGDFEDEERSQASEEASDCLVSLPSSDDEEERKPHNPFHRSQFQSFQQRRIKELHHISNFLSSKQQEPQQEQQQQQKARPWSADPLSRSKRVLYSSLNEITLSAAVPHTTVPRAKLVQPCTTKEQRRRDPLHDTRQHYHKSSALLLESKRSFNADSASAKQVVTIDPTMRVRVLMNGPGITRGLHSKILCWGEFCNAMTGFNIKNNNHPGCAEHRSKKEMLQVEQQREQRAGQAKHRIIMQSLLLAAVEGAEVVKASAPKKSAHEKRELDAMEATGVEITDEDLILDARQRFQVRYFGNKRSVVQAPADLLTSRFKVTVATCYKEVGVCDVCFEVYQTLDRLRLLARVKADAIAVTHDESVRAKPVSREQLTCLSFKENRLVAHAGTHRYGERKRLPRSSLSRLLVTTRPVAEDEDEEVLRERAAGQPLSQAVSQLHQQWTNKPPPPARGKQRHSSPTTSLSPSTLDLDDNMYDLFERPSPSAALHSPGPRLRASTSTATATKAERYNASKNLQGLPRYDDATDEVIFAPTSYSSGQLPPGLQGFDVQLEQLTTFPRTSSGKPLIELKKHRPRPQSASVRRSLAHQHGSKQRPKSAAAKTRAKTRASSPGRNRKPSLFKLSTRAACSVYRNT